MGAVIRSIMKISLAFVLISAVSLSRAGRVPELDKCPPKPPTIAEFDTNAYLGDWYTYATTPGFFQPTGTECQRVQRSHVQGVGTRTRDLWVRPARGSRAPW